jgi:shikimate kinase
MLVCRFREFESFLASVKSVFLIGLMGAGKTTIGQLLARRLNFKFLDSDHVIEARTGASVETIFEIEGEQAFRAREAELIDELTQLQDIVLATGGGAVTSASSREHLKARGTVVYLHATAYTSYARVRKSHDRPLLLTNDPLQTLLNLYELRHPLYVECATHVVESHRDRPGLVVQEVISLIE